MKDHDSSAFESGPSEPTSTAGERSVVPCPKREIFFGNRYEMCDVILMDGDLMVVTDRHGRELICRPAYGTWMAYSISDLISRLQYLERSHKELCALEVAASAPAAPLTPLGPVSNADETKE